MCSHGKRVGIYMDTMRYRCRTCTKTFYERLPDVDGKRDMTAEEVSAAGRTSRREHLSLLDAFQNGLINTDGRM